jgi:gamma-glutamylcyclotransferase (GGCT)/AIG2-like uncharacterized protein YtfP
VNEPRASRERWLSPGGIGAIAGIVGAIAAVVALFLTRSDPDPPAPAPTQQHTYLFVYGTTMPGHTRYPLIEQFVARATPDSVEGQLFDTGFGYPAAKFGAGLGTIEGYLLRLRPERVADARRTFTEIEAGLFEPVSVETASGVEATAYEWIRSTDGMEPIDGMWSGEEG